MSVSRSTDRAQRRERRDANAALIKCMGLAMIVGSALQHMTPEYGVFGGMGVILIGLLIEPH